MMIMFTTGTRRSRWQEEGSKILYVRGGAEREWANPPPTYSVVVSRHRDVRVLSRSKFKVLVLGVKKTKFEYWVLQKN
jgi:hypothetical protein